MIGYSSYLSENAVAIFLFHGVIRQQRHLVRNYTQKHLEQDRFVSVLRELLSGGIPVSMDQIARSGVEGATLPGNAFAITFDDGFENNYSVAASVLSEFGVPATFYVTTGFVDSNSLSWTDIIEYAVERTPSVRLNLSFLRTDQIWQNPKQKIELLDRIRSHVKTNSEIDPYQIADTVCRQLGVAEIVPEDDLDKKLSWRQVKALDAEALFTVGGHSHSHRILSFLNSEDLDFEITTSLAKLLQCLGYSTKHYSYPEGLNHCYSDAVIERLKRNGVICSPTAEPGVNRMGDDPFRLKRISVV